jgi:DNA-binding protein HU-beta
MQPQQTNSDFASMKLHPSRFTFSLPHILMPTLARIYSYQNTSMNHQKLVERIAQKTGITPAETTTMLASCIDMLLQEVAQGNTVSIQGFGNFELKEKSQRKIYNPSTKEFNTIPAKQTLGFRPSNLLKEKIKN